MIFASALPGHWRKDAEVKCFMENHSNQTFVISLKSYFHPQISLFSRADEANCISRMLVLMLDNLMAAYPPGDINWESLFQLLP